MNGKEHSGDQDLESHNDEVQLLKLRDHQAASADQAADVGDYSDRIEEHQRWHYS